MNFIGKVLKDILTVKNGRDFDIGKFAWAGSLISLIGFEGYAVCWHGQVFDPQAFAIGLGAVMACGGAARGLKRMTEPQDEGGLSDHHEETH